MTTKEIYEELDNALSAVFSAVIVPAIVSQAMESTVPSEKITEQSRLADWLFNQLYNVNVTSMFNSQVRKKLLDEVHALAYISEPMYESCFSFYLRLNCSVANVVNLLSFAHSASLVTQGEYHTHDLTIRDITDTKLKEDGLYLLMIVIVSLGLQSSFVDMLNFAYDQAKPQEV